MSDETRRLNHWVPISYLAAFTDSGTADGVLIVHDRERPGKTRTVAPKGIAAERDLYVVRQPEGDLDDAIERLLATHVEGPFVELHRKLIAPSGPASDRDLTPAERGILGTFAAFQHLRTPLTREMYTFFLTFQAAIIARSSFMNPGPELQRFNEATGSSLTEAEVKSWVEGFDTEGFVLKIHDKLWLGPFLANVVEMATLAANLPVVFVRAPSNNLFMTSDHPVTIVRRPMDSLTWRMGGGWLEDSAEITLPLSPSVVAVFGRSVSHRKDLGTPDWINDVARRTAEGCFRWTYTSTADDRVQPWLSGSRPPEWEVRYPGGSVRPGQSIQQAVRDMMSLNPRKATIEFGRPD